MDSCMPVVFKVTDRVMASDVVKRSVEASRAVDPDFAHQELAISKQDTCSAALTIAESRTLS